MRRAIKFVIGLVLCGTFLGAVGKVLTTPRAQRTIPGQGGWMQAAALASPDPRRGTPRGSSPAFPIFSAGGFETAGYSTAARFTGPIQDRGSIEQVRDAFATRSQRGLADRLAELGAIPREGPDPSFRRLRVQASIVYLLMYEGRFAEAAEWTERALEENPGAPPT